MTITGTTRVFMIVGDPVAQVRAPEVYNHLLAQHGIDAALVPMKVPPAGLPDFVKSVFEAQNVGGMWVTIPHKAAMTCGRGRQNEPVADPSMIRATSSRMPPY